MVIVSDHIQVQVPYPIPATPSNLSRTVGDGEVTLSWDRVQHATGYEVQQWDPTSTPPGFRTLPFDTYTINIDPGVTLIKATIGGLTNGITYTHQVRSTNPSGHSGWSSLINSEPQAKLDAPTDLNITPLGLRKALLTWEAGSNNDNNTRYVVEVTPPPGAGWRPVKFNIDNMFYEIQLDDALSQPNFPVSLADHDYFKFRLMAVDGRATPIYKGSAHSEEVIIRDNPLLLENGQAYGADDETRLRWRAFSETGVANLQQSITYRKLSFRPGFPDKQHHWDYDWPTDEDWPYYLLPEEPVFVATNIPGIVVGQTISRLDSNEIYAVQVNYTYEKNDRIHQVFSARDAYVWTSSNFPEVSSLPRFRERVATFPYFGHHKSREFKYVICDDTFQMDKNEWLAVIREGFGKWQLATGGLVTVREIPKTGPLR